MTEAKICKTKMGEIEYVFEGKGPTILFVHGGHASCYGNFKQNMMIKNSFSVLISTRPGYGNTPKESGKTAKETACLFRELLKELQIDKVFVVGISAGGPVALEFAKLFPDVVQKLVLESAVVKPWFHKLTVQYYGVKVIFAEKRQKKFWQNLKKKLEDNEMKTLRQNISRFTKLNIDGVLKRMSKDDMVELKESLVTGNDSGSGFILDVEHRAKNIEQIKCPTLIIHSKNDGSVGFSHVKFAKRKIRNSELFVAPTDTHFIWFGKGSKEVLKKRLAFLTGA